jgi:hypothetical protein
MLCMHGAVDTGFKKVTVKIQIECKSNTNFKLAIVSNSLPNNFGCSECLFQYYQEYTLIITKGLKCYLRLDIHSETTIL